jgi:hypothetical protein
MAAASEAHVTIIATAPDASRTPAAAHATATARPRPRPARPTLQPVAAAEAHVQLVPVNRPVGTVVPLRDVDRTTETDPWEALTSAVLASVKARHPSAGTVGELATVHDDTLHVLRPMPSPEPLPKPSVIQRRSTDGARGATPGPDALVVPLRPRRAASARCQTFESDDEGYGAWLCANPHGYVLNVAAHRAKAVATLHRAACPTVTTARRGQVMTGTPKVCDTSRQELHRWAVIQDTESSSCRRCLP